jgi:hypothetical protein
MNSIKPTYVTFEQAKWLKEKGFDVNCMNAYAEERLIDKKTGGDKFTGIYRLVTKSRFHKRYYSAPEQWQVIEWLRVNHGIWIYSSWGTYYDKTVWYYYISTTGKKSSNNNDSRFKSPQEAISAAFDYILNNNLI